MKRVKTREKETVEAFGSLNPTQRVMEEMVEGMDDRMDEDAETVDPTEVQERVILLTTKESYVSKVHSQLQVANTYYLLNQPRVARGGGYITIQ